MNLDLLVPTRYRPKLFKEFVDSVDRMTANKDRIKLHFIVDYEDNQTIPYVEAVKKEYSHINSEIHYVERQNTVETFNLNEQYYNFVARKCTGDLIWVLGDDVEIVSPRWDEQVEIEVNNFTVKYPDKIFITSILDNTKPPSHKLPKYPCFPMFTQEAKSALGNWILHPKIPTWGNDYILYCIFYQIDRILYLHNKTYLNHKSWHTKQVEVDETNNWIGHVFNQMKHVPHCDTERIIDQEVPRIAGDLKRIINEFYLQPKENQNAN
jgi:hypothetical protein